MHPEISPSSLKIFCPAHTILTFVARKISAIQLDLKKAPLTRVHIHGALRNKANVYTRSGRIILPTKTHSSSTRDANTKRIAYSRGPPALSHLSDYTPSFSLSPLHLPHFFVIQCLGRALLMSLFAALPSSYPLPGPFRKVIFTIFPVIQDPFCASRPLTPLPRLRALCVLRTPASSSFFSPR